MVILKGFLKIADVQSFFFFCKLLEVQEMYPW